MCFDWFQYLSFEFTEYKTNSRFISDSFGFIDYDLVKPAKQKTTAESTEIIPSFFFFQVALAQQIQASTVKTLQN